MNTGVAYTAAHWGIYKVERDSDNAPSLKAFEHDLDPSPIGLAMLDACRADIRVQRPSVRKSWLDHGWGARPDLRGIDPYVEISWNEALDLAAGALRDVIARRGNKSVFGGSYGWSSAGRFHHALSQIHRFLNSLGGYVRQSDSYSLGAGRVLMPHIVATMDQLMANHTSWDVLAKNTRLFVAFGGVPAKNTQISQGLVGSHNVKAGLAAMQKAGVRFINIGPVNNNLDTGGDHEWIPIRPDTDTAMLLAIGYTLYTEGLHNAEFLHTHCAGFDKFVPYLTGASDGIPKTPEWASAITTVPAERIRTLARELAATRSVVTIAWGLQRAHHGEQPFWSLVTIACMLGQIGLPGGGFGVGYGAANSIGNVNPGFTGPTLPQGANAVTDFIPCARIVDMLENPGQIFRYNGQTLSYPDIELIYWAGGNPFHHHQDLNRLLQAWRKPKAVIIQEQFWTAAAKASDLVLPVTTALERDDIGFSTNERFMVAMKKVIEPIGEARDDFSIFADIAERLGARERYTEGLNAAEWIRRIYGEGQGRARQAGVDMPDFDAFWEMGLFDISPLAKSHVMLEAFRRDPVANPLPTPSGKIEIFSERIASFDYDDCVGHACWFEPIEWLGSAKVAKYPLHMLSDQPSTRLHSQLDHSSYSQGNKVNGREPMTISPVDAKARGISEGDVVRVWNDRGSCLAGARISDAIRPGVVKLSTGAWFDPTAWNTDRPLEKHGNPNALTLDLGTSQLSQGCSAQTCLVQIERVEGTLPVLTAFSPPPFVAR